MLFRSYTNAKDIICSVAQGMVIPAAWLYPFARLSAKIFGHADLAQADALSAVRYARLPILLIHGEDDHFVPLKMAFENRDACAAPCKLLVVPGADHAMSYYMGRGAYEAAVRAFWEHFDK